MTNLLARDLYKNGAYNLPIFSVLVW